MAVLSMLLRGEADKRTSLVYAQVLDIDLATRVPLTAFREQFGGPQLLASPELSYSALDAAGLYCRGANGKKANKIVVVNETILLSEPFRRLCANGTNGHPPVRNCEI
jgi:hypothetical protein